MKTTSFDIRALRKEYSLSQADLANELGVSRPTLIAIEKGNRSVSEEEMKKIQEIFKHLAELKDNPAQDMRIEIPQKNLEKFKQIFLYILDQVGGKPNIGMTALYKLLYFIDFDYYEKYEEQLMGLTYIKNHYGPTPKEFIKVIDFMKKSAEIEEVKSEYFKREQTKYLPLKKPDLSLLSARDIELIQNVLHRLSDKSAKELSDYSHGDVPWSSHEDGEEINYESVFYRNDPYSVRSYVDEI